MDSSPTKRLGRAAEPLPCSPTLWLGLKPRETAAMLVISLLVLAASYRGWSAIGVAEAWGFVTGGICVWLVLREHLWNWPVGLANNVLLRGPHEERVREAVRLIGSLFKESLPQAAGV